MKGVWVPREGVVCVKCQKVIVPGKLGVVEDGTDDWHHYPKCPRSDNAQ